MVMPVRPSALATKAVVPVPPNGSQTRPRSGVQPWTDAAWPFHGIRRKMIYAQVLGHCEGLCGDRFQDTAGEACPTGCRWYEG